MLSEEEGEEEEEEEDILSLAEEKYRPAALEKMIALVALLVEQSRSERWNVSTFKMLKACLVLFFLHICFIILNLVAFVT